jgi:hypothetical protein
MTADKAVQMLVGMMENTEVPFGVRAKIAQDLLDRAGLVAAQVHKIIPTTEDPVMRFFEGAFSDLSNWVSNPQPDPTPALESSATSNRYRHDAEPEEILEAEIVDDAEPGDDTPLRVALLADVNRWVGVFTAMVGAVVALPSGTRGFSRRRGDGSSGAGSSCAITSPNSSLSHDGMARRGAPAR